MTNLFTTKINADIINNYSFQNDVVSHSGKNRLRKIGYSSACFVLHFA